MATYKGIQGYSVPKLTTDPTGSDVVGQLWYNSTEGAFKISVTGTGSWASGGALNTARAQMGGCGTQTATLAMYGSPSTAAAETYDGTSWTNTTSANSQRYDGGSFGQLQTAAGYCGGYGVGPPPLQSTLTEIWNGSTWTESGDLVTGRQGFYGGAGTTLAGLVSAAGPADGKTETFNGSTWTEVAVLVTPRQYAAVCGLTSTAAICVGGYGIPAASPYSNGPGSRVGLTETWDGTSWTQSANTLALGRIESGISGTSTDAVIAGGSTGDPAPPTAPTATAETWDGTSWTSAASMSDVQKAGGASSSGGSTTAILFGGGPAGSVSASEEWTSPLFTVKTVTVS
jgi:hypothetical protein